MADRTFQNPPRLTFGVEFEFLLSYLPYPGPDPLENVQGLTPITTRPPRQYTENEWDEDSHPTRIHKTIKRTLEANGLEPELKASDFRNWFDERALGRFADWSVKHDLSVQEPDEQGQWTKIGDDLSDEGPEDPTRWLDVEINSPILVDSPVSFEKIDYVRELVLRNYRVRVNPSCGLHVHVGWGSERFPLESAKRVAAMAWAAEHLLVTLNRPDRQACWYCPLLRNWSNIARGSFEGAMINSRLRFISGDTRHGEMPISWREQNSGQDICEAFAITRQEGCFEPLRWDDPDDTPSAEKNGGEQSTSGSKGAASIEPSKATEPSGGAPKPAESTEPIDPSERKSVPNVAPSSPSKVPLPDSPRKRSKQKPVPPTMASSEGLNSPSNIAQIRTIPRIARPRYSIKQLEALRDGLVDYGNSGLDYERSYKKDPGVFEGVRHIFNTTSTIEIAHLLNTRLGRGWTNFYSYGREEVKTVGGNRTIEFRGAEGTLGPWATTWARICVGLVRFALYAPPAVFGDILTKCEYSTNEDGYDVIDLLNDLGLYTEAAEAEQRFIQNMNEWGLEFVPESDSP